MLQKVSLCIVACVFISQCTHSPRVATKSSGNRAYEQALDLAFAELSRNSRLPASASNKKLGFELKQLRHLKPQRFEVFVFPKAHHAHVKFITPSKVTLASPINFEVHLPAIAPCSQFIKGNFFASQLNPKELFDPHLGETSQHCAIVEVIDQKLKDMDRALIRKGDVLGRRLFIDEGYQLHGEDWILHSSDKNIRTQRVKTNPKMPSSSGLSLFPVDLPSIHYRGASPELKSIHPSRFGLDQIAINMVQSRYLRSFNPQPCEGYEFSYLDAFGEAIQVGWCKDSPWPYYIENSKFLSVTQSIEIGK